MKLIIEGRLPGLNDYIAAERTNRYKAAKIKRETQESIGWQIKAQGLQPVTAPVKMHYLWVEPNAKRDKDNIVFAKKFIQDAFVECGILQNDGWKQVIEFTDRFLVNKNNPHIEVVIEEVAQ